jgi:hypothetical protein
MFFLKLIDYFLSKFYFLGVDQPSSQGTLIEQSEEVNFHKLVVLQLLKLVHELGRLR